MWDWGDGMLTKNLDGIEEKFNINDYNSFFGKLENNRCFIRTGCFSFIRRLKWTEKKSCMLEEAGERTVILIEKSSSTPAKYPRPSAKIAKNPIK